MTEATATPPGNSTTGTKVTDRGRLARDLKQAVKGEVRFDEGSRALYSNDASIYRQTPIGVVLPRDADDVYTTLRIAREHGAPIVARGGGTGLAGQSVNVAVMLDFSKHMNRILEIDSERRVARVQPGVICDQLRDEVAKYGLTYAPDPATHDRCTFGGMLGNNSCGVHSVMGGKTVDNVLSLDVVTYDGTRMRVGPTDDAAYDDIVARGGRQAEIYRDLRELRDSYGELIKERYPDIPRRVSGYNLDDLLPENGFDVAKALVGSESTCVLAVEATVRLVPQPPERRLVVIGFPDAPAAADYVPEALECGPIGLECFDQGILRNLRLKEVHYRGMDELPEGGAWLLAEFGGDTADEAHHRASALAERIPAMSGADGKLVDDPGRAGEIWEVRRSAIGSTRIPGEHGGHAAWEDAAVAPERLGDYLRDFLRLTEEYGYHIALFGHFGEGCVHCRHDLDLVTADGIENFRRYVDACADLVVSYGGSLSGEHGDGQLRGPLLHKMYGPELVEAFREFKRIWDPELAMNPGKVVDPYRPDQNVRLGTSYRPREVETHFAYSGDASFADAVNRCFGIGKCRHHSGGVMCPSFMVTYEEKHSTRGRARMLHEMMRDEGGRPRGEKFWRDDNVKEALDLCLSCKGCRTDCPVGVDMATYKAEFLSHYYAGRVRPRAAYALGLIPVWARLASIAPGLANTATHAPWLSRVVKLGGGIQPERDAPGFAGRTFREWFEGRSRPSAVSEAGRREVFVWPDTFNNHFSPEVGVAATEVLEAAGFTVRLPERVMCCGRPLYDYGMLPTAKRYLRRILDELREPLSEGIPIVGLEPSCLAVFRDELPNLFPGDADAARLSSQSFLLAEFLRRYAPDFAPRLDRTALIQGHCHQHAVMGFDADTELTGAMGLDARRPDSGCCGLAGSFGYEKGERYDVAQAAGERVILPEVRDAPKDTLVLADGFSCREQIAGNTDRRPLHLAQVLRLALDEADGGREAVARESGSQHGEGSAAAGRQPYGEGTTGPAGRQQDAPYDARGDYPERSLTEDKPRADRKLAVGVSVVAGVILVAGAGIAVAVARGRTRR